MRVALITPEFPPEYSGGLGVHVASLAQHLRSQGDDVDVYRTDALVAKLRIVLSAGLPRQSAVDGAIEEVGRAAVREFDARHDRAPYDILHCHGWEGAALASQLSSRAPIVTTIHLPSTYDTYESAASYAAYGWGDAYYAQSHRWWPYAGYGIPYSVPSHASPYDGYGFQAAQQTTQTEFDRVRLQMIARRLETHAVGVSTLVLTVSGFTVHQLERSYGPLEQIRLIHNGVDTTEFAEDGSERQPLVLAVGRYVPQKGFCELPSIFALARNSIPNARLRIVGSGPQETALSAELYRAGLAHVAELRPFVSHHDIGQHYREAYVLAMPSMYEPFGLVAIEAMACGTPVVAYDVGGLREIITSGYDGILIRRGDRIAFAEALVQLWSDANRARLMGQRARQTVMARFSLETCGNRTRQSYSDAIAMWQDGKRVQHTP